MFVQTFFVTFIVTSSFVSLFSSEHRESDHEITQNIISEQPQNTLPYLQQYPTQSAFTPEQIENTLTIERGIFHDEITINKDNEQQFLNAYNHDYHLVNNGAACITCCACGVFGFGCSNGMLQIVNCPTECIIPIASSIGSLATCVTLHACKNRLQQDAERRISFMKKLKEQSDTYIIFATTNTIPQHNNYAHNPLGNSLTELHLKDQAFYTEVTSFYNNNTYDTMYGYTNENYKNFCYSCLASTCTQRFTHEAALAYLPTTASFACGIGASCVTMCLAQKIYTHCIQKNRTQKTQYLLTNKENKQK